MRITCPTCGRAYKPEEIFYPSDWAEETPKEEYECDSCNTKFSVQAEFVTKKIIPKKKELF